jgi:hypothetical protein
LNNQLRQKCIEAADAAYWKAYITGSEQRMTEAFDAMLDVLADNIFEWERAAMESESGYVMSSTLLAVLRGPSDSLEETP